jgi:hypothetical protein
MEITVRTTQHGFALEIDNKGWLLENEQQLAEAVVFRIGMGCKGDVSKRYMHKLLTALAYGNTATTDNSDCRRRGGRAKRPRINSK